MYKNRNTWHRVCWKEYFYGVAFSRVFLSARGARIRLSFPLFISGFKKLLRKEGRTDSPEPPFQIFRYVTFVKLSRRLAGPWQAEVSSSCKMLWIQEQNLFSNNKMENGKADDCLTMDLYLRRVETSGLQKQSRNEMKTPCREVDRQDTTWFFQFIPYSIYSLFNLSFSGRWTGRTYPDLFNIL